MSTRAPEHRRDARATRAHKRDAWTALLFLVVALARASAALAASNQDSEQTVGPLRSDSRAPYVHRLTLYDHDGAAISPDDVPALPYSPRATCGKCHDYGTISRGWHFNAPDEAVPAGRRGEPWLLVDPVTGTQLPITGRKWPGAYTPAEIGLTNWQFVLSFGGHTPGGGFGEPTDEEANESPEALRWRVSGKLEIDCMFCHSADQQHEPAEAARQIEKENFKWAPTVALGLAVVRGEARKAPDDWDPLMPPDLDFPERAGPRLVWNRARFDPDDRVFFNTTRRPPAERCYFCHFAREVGAGSRDEMEVAQDVHLAAGLTCIDCHRNGLDHMMTRGYATEAEERGDPSVAAFSCEGCHLGTDGAGAAEVSLGGRYGAPHPQHKGLPPLHFEKLTCTACHSGPWPELDAKRFQTSMAHGLGLASRERADDDPPRIVGPIFARQQDGKIAPQRMIWPAYLGVMLDDEEVVPCDLDRAAGLVKEGMAELYRTSRSHDIAPLDTAENVAKMLEAIAHSTQFSSEGWLAYVGNGRVHRLDDPDRVEVVDHPGAAPYRWSIGHNVRPASQSLGINGCTDCHADDAPIFFGRIADAASQEEDGATPVRLMHELRGDDPTVASTWNLGFRFRPAFNWFGFACAAAIGLVLLHYVLAGIGAITRRFR